MTTSKAARARQFINIGHDMISIYFNSPVSKHDNEQSSEGKAGDDSDHNAGNSTSTHTFVHLFIYHFVYYLIYHLIYCFIYNSIMPATAPPATPLFVCSSNLYIQFIIHSYSSIILILSCLVHLLGRPRCPVLVPLDRRSA